MTAPLVLEHVGEDEGCSLYVLKRGDVDLLGLIAEDDGSLRVLTWAADGEACDPVRFVPGEGAVS